VRMTTGLSRLPLNPMFEYIRAIFKSYHVLVVIIRLIVIKSKCYLKFYLNVLSRNDNNYELFPTIHGTIVSPRRYAAYLHDGIL
jgi:hypothetical protein